MAAAAGPAAGLAVRIIADPTDNPLDRLEVRVDPEEAGTAGALADALAAADPPIIVRDHEVEHGRFYPGSCNLHPGEAETIAATLDAIRGQPVPSLEELREWARTRLLVAGLTLQVAPV